MPKINLPPVIQKTDSHCGPAVLEQLLAFRGLQHSQDVIAQAAGIYGTIEKDGTRPSQLALAVQKLAPQLQFWFKNNATKHTIHRLIHEYGCPVGINWQGLFYDSLEEETREEESYSLRGHYSVVIDIDLLNNTITIANPYREFGGSPRTYSLSWFESRWWDVVADMNPDTGEIETVTTRHFLFVIVPNEADFPTGLSMEHADNLTSLKTTTTAALPLTNLFHLPGQSAFIRKFEPDSENDFLAMQDIMEQVPVQQWMDNIGELDQKAYEEWAGDTSDDSFLFAVHNAAGKTILEVDSVLGFVYFYSGDEEKQKVPQMQALGILPVVENRWVLEVSFAKRTRRTLQAPVQGLVSSALRQACLWVHMKLAAMQNRPVEIFAFIDPRNEPARRTLESSGFVKRGMMRYDADSLEDNEVYVLDWQALSGKLRLLVG